MSNPAKPAMNGSVVIVPDQCGYALLGAESVEQGKDRNVVIFAECPFIKSREDPYV